MTKGQIRKLEQALELIQDSIGYEKISEPKIISTWLSVAIDYLSEVKNAYLQSNK